MIKGVYDVDCGTWSPQGKLIQVEYAMEAVKQGSICLGLKSQEYAVLCSLKRAPSELSSYMDKTFKVDDHMGLSMAGLTADARSLCKYMRNECLNYKYNYEVAHPVERLIFKIAEKSQKKTQSVSTRPYGVGLLVIGVDQTGTHLFETCPSGNFYEYNAYSIGARSQAARTYLENHFQKFSKASLERLILHGLKALKGAVQEETDFNTRSVEIAFVGLKENFTTLKEDQVDSYLKKLADFKPETEMEIQ